MAISKTDSELSSIKMAAFLMQYHETKKISCKYYDVYKLDVEGKATIDISDNPFTIMSVVSGEGSIDGHALTKGDHFILPCGYDVATFEGCMEIVASTVPVA